MAGRPSRPPSRTDTRVVTGPLVRLHPLELSRGRTVVWGSGEKGAAKARALTALMKAAPKARHFDVSAPTAPAVVGELTHICAGQHPGWAALRLIT